MVGTLTADVAGATSGPVPHWSEVADSGPAPRDYSAMAFDTATGQMVLVGGTGYFGDTYNATWGWSGTSWAKLDTSGPTLVTGAVAYDPATGQLLYYGGSGSTTTWAWNGTSWSAVASTGPPALGGPSMVFDTATGQLLLFGGQPGSGTTTATWTWNGTGWTAMTSATPPPHVRDASAAYDPATAQLVVFGGQADGTEGAQATTWTWSGTNWSTLSPATSAPARTGAVLAYDASVGRMVLYGGTGADGRFLRTQWEWTGTTWVTDPLYGLPVPPVHGDAAAYDVGTGQLVLFGGASGTGSISGATWVFGYPTSTTFDWSKSAAVGPAKLNDTAMAFDPATGQTLLFGGFNGTHQVTTTWLWTGSAWTKLSTATTPPGGTRPAMAFDQATDQLLLYGGATRTTTTKTFHETATTWVWTGSNWHKLDPSENPGPRSSAALAFDPVTGQMLLLGGRDTTTTPTQLRATWLWTGSTWLELTSTTPLSAPTTSVMSFDPATGQLLLYGGLLQGGPAQTYLWIGTNWVEQTPATIPSGQIGSSLAFDPTVDEPVAFAGLTELGYDTSTTDGWNGANWATLAPTTSPPTRSDASMAFDSATAQLVVFGGTGTSGVLASTTWVLSPAPGLSLPGKPTAVRGNDSVTLSWAAPTPDGTAVESYTVTSSPTTATCSPTTPTDPTCTITGLPVGVTYLFSVTATYATGTSTPGPASTPVLVAALPPAPTTVRAVPGNGTALVSWESFTDGGTPFTGFTVRSSPGTRTCTTGGPTARRCTVSGLMDGTAYTFTVTAANGIGTSAPSTPSRPVTPFAPLTAPRGLTASATLAGIVLHWQPPATTGKGPLTGYRVLRWSSYAQTPAGLVQTLGPQTTTWTDTTAQLDTPYGYEVEAVTGPGASGPSTPATAEIVAQSTGSGFAATGTLGGWWTVTAAGAVSAGGGASRYGSLPALGVTPSSPVVGIASTPDGKGYWLVGADGGVFAFGDATYYGSLPGIATVHDIVGMASSPDGKGYWLVGADGGVFAFGDAPYLGSAGTLTLAAPVVGMAVGHGGYYLVGSDGGVFAYGARFEGAAAGGQAASATVGVVPDIRGIGYTEVRADATTASEPT